MSLKKGALQPRAGAGNGECLEGMGAGLAQPRRAVSAGSSPCFAPRKPLQSHGSTTGTASSSTSLMTTTSGTSSPPSPCLGHSWYVGEAGEEAEVASFPVLDSASAPQVLLTLDDDLDTVQRDKIYVF